MSILFTNEIWAAVMQEMTAAEESVQIITAYCKEKTIKSLSNYISKNILDKKIMIRFRLDDILKGSTDFQILRYCMDSGWKVYLRFDLHAKTYILDNKRGIIGSANVTNSGLSLGKSGNIEMGTLVDIELPDLDKIAKLYRDAILVDEQLYQRLKRQYEASASTKSETASWNNDITSLFKPHVDSLFSYELPESGSVRKGDYIAFLDIMYDGNIEEVRRLFRWSSSYLWLLTTLEENDGCLFFGALTEKLHSVLITDPKPYRREVKLLLANLLRMVEDLEMEEIIIDRPNYSQRVRLKNK